MFISLQRVIKSGVLTFRRNGVLSLAAVGIMVLTISAITGLLLLGVTTDRIVALLHDKVDISVYFVLDAKEQDIRKVESQLRALPEVKDVRYVSRDEALLRFQERYSQNQVVLEAIKEVEKNPLPASLNIKAYEASQYAAVSKFLEGEKFKPLINKINYFQNKQMIDRLFSMTDVVARSGLAISLILGLIAVLVAFNTIRLAIYSLKDEIAVMRLVGASNWFIRGPFVVVGAVSGVLAAFITMVMFYVVSYYLSPRLESFVPGLSLWVYYNSNLLQIFVIQLFTGISIGVISSLVAINRYLKI